MQPKLSVVMSVKNHAHYLTDSIKSICNQTFDNFELLIADDASTDDSYSILNEAMKQDKRIKVFKNSTPEYFLVTSEGPPHDRTFTVIVSINGIKYETGTAKSKKQAEQIAAFLTLQKFKEL